MEGGWRIWPSGPTWWSSSISHAPASPTCGWRSWRSPKGPRWQGRSLQELSGPAVPLLVRHPDGQLIANPARKLQLQPGDVLVIFGEVSDLNPLDRD